jgi:transcriptional regulator of arginine metabolism
MQKHERHDLILKVIGSEPISRQDVLAAKLGRAGHAVTQASISRDLDELGIRKVDGIYARVRATPELRLELKSVALAGDNLVVVKTDSGMASAATVRIDAANIAEIVGTIAGDDTVFVAIAGADSRGPVIKQIEALFGK